MHDWVFFRKLYDSGKLSVGEVLVRPDFLTLTFRRGELEVNVEPLARVQQKRERSLPRNFSCSALFLEIGKSLKIPINLYRN